MYIVIAAHGHFADSLVASARMVTGYQGGHLYPEHDTRKGHGTACAEAAC